MFCGLCRSPQWPSVSALSVSATPQRPGADRGRLGQYEVGRLRAGHATVPRAVAGGRCPGLDEAREPDGADRVLRLRQRQGELGGSADHGAAAGAPTVEAHKTEPDKNTYLVFKKGLQGADPDYDYGTHFLFQGHESGTPGYMTRINLDADAAHRVTLLATSAAEPATSTARTWDPWAKQLLFTTENAAAPTYAVTADYPATVTDLSGSIGRGGYEGIQNDSDGNLWIVEDIGGANEGGCRGRHDDGQDPQQLHVPLRAEHARGPRQRQAAGAAGQQRRRRNRSRSGQPDRR